MKLSLNRMSEKLIWVLTVLMMASCITFQAYTWRRYIYFFASIVIFILAAFGDKWHVKIKFEAYYAFMLLFSGYCCMSALWAINPGDSIQKAETVFQILCCNMLLYVYYQKEDNVQKLLCAVMWTGYVASIYTIYYYGLEGIMDAAKESRLVSEFANVNTVGMTAAVSGVIQVHELLYNQHRRSAIFLVPSVIVIAACQSKKAIALLLLGSVAVFFLKNWQGKKSLNHLLKFVFLALGAIGIVVIVYFLPMFAGIRVRIDSMIMGLFKKGATDISTWERMTMTRLGWEWFKKHPVGGIGIGNAHVVVASYLGKDTYMHNNFVELLCSGGLIGFLIYYGMYFYLFQNLLRYKHADRKHFEICFVWLVLMLIMDYAMVSYYEKPQWIYLMIHFLNISCLKKKSMVMKNAAEKVDPSRMQVPCIL